MHRRSLTLSLLLWISLPLITTPNVRAEAFWKAVETAAGVAKTMWDLGSSLIPNAADYGIYGAQFYPERYADQTESYDHSTLTTVKRNNWRDPIDGSSRYLTETFSKSGKQTSEAAFIHGWGNCTWTCSASTDPKAFEVNGTRTTIQIST